MKKLGKHTILLGVLVATGVFAGQQLLGDDEEAAGTRHMVNQLWVERWPDGQRDMFGKLAILRTEHGRVGLVGRSSTWRHFYELFLWAQEGDTLMTAFPQEGHRARFKVRTWKCEGEAPEPFELCLEIRRGERKAVFYSKREWEIRPHQMEDDLEAIREENPWLGSMDVPGELPAVDVDALDEAGADFVLGQ